MKETNRYGIPQGSVLGPLLFLIYINDIHVSSKVFKFYLFADDTNILYADKNLKSLETIVNKELVEVCEWLNSNKLTLNLRKTNYVIFRPYQVSVKLFDNSTNNSIEIECKEFVKYLGVLIDSKSTKISKAISIIARLRHFVPVSTLHNIYRCLILPYITYGLIVWVHASNRYVNKILILQKRPLRLIYFKKIQRTCYSTFY
jgi:hypothetical protein